MRISDARYEGGNLILSSLDPDARRFPYGFKPGEYQITKAKQKKIVGRQRDDVGFDNQNR